MINHPAEALNRKDPDVGVLGEDQMGDFFHKGVWVVICGLVSACGVHDSLCVENVELDDEVGHDLERDH